MPGWSPATPRPPPRPRHDRPAGNGPRATSPVPSPEAIPATSHLTRDDRETFQRDAGPAVRLSGFTPSHGGEGGIRRCLEWRVTRGGRWQHAAGHRGRRGNGPDDGVPWRAAGPLGARSGEEQGRSPADRFLRADQQVKRGVTPDVAASYAVRSFRVLTQLRLPRQSFSASQPACRFRQFAADGGWLDVEARLRRGRRGDPGRDRGAGRARRAGPRRCRHRRHHQVARQLATDAGTVPADVVVAPRGWAPMTCSACCRTAMPGSRCGPAGRRSRSTSSPPRGCAASSPSGRCPSLRVRGRRHPRASAV